MKNKGGSRRSLFSLLVGICVVGAIWNFIPHLPSPVASSQQIWRFLSAEPGKEPSIYPWARNHLNPLAALPPGPSNETVVFWNVPRSGGTLVKAMYECTGRTLAHKAGADPKFGHRNKEELIAFRPWPGVSKASYVNVDTTSKQGIDRAKRLGLVPSGLVDIIITSDPAYIVEKLFDRTHKGRALALFRHPVDRLVSKFYYLQVAAWEDQYRPQWKRLDLKEWARTKNTDNNHMVKRLAGLGVNDKATEVDLRIAMRTIRNRFVVGLTYDMEESIRRFNAVMGIDASPGDNAKCMDHFFYRSTGAKKMNANPHPVVQPGTQAWEVLAKANALDVKLYEFIQQIFYEQTETIEEYKHALAPDPFQAGPLPSKNISNWHSNRWAGSYLK